MLIFTYRCPATGYRVEGRQRHVPPAAARPLNTYVAETCPACRGLHIVNPATGRLISEEASRPPPWLAAPPTEPARATSPCGPAA